MASALSIITDALQRLGVVATGQQPSSEDASVCLAALNSLIDSLGLQALMAPSVGIAVYTVAGGAVTVTIGPNQAIPWPTVPVQIEEGAFMRKSGMDYPIEVVNLATYQGIGIKTIQTNTPDVLYYNRGPSAGILSIYPAMAGDGEIHLPIQQQLGKFADLVTDSPLLQGYQRMLAYSLAEDMQDTFGRQLSPASLQRAALLRRDARRANLDVPFLVADAEQRRFNILTGDR